MKRTALITAILAGYGAISFGFVKIIWLIQSGHSYWIDPSHAPQAPIYVDLFLTGVLLIGGLYLVLLREIIAALLIVFVACLIEAAALEFGPNQFGKLSVIVIVMIGQVIVLWLNFMVIIENERRVQKQNL